ncbi:hypothetical protein C0Q70_21379 [Pomacea canaliculata]|uniref:EGF-like domain-containing protein n=1 Tax=Pomacea canaliculata TaxID=400727 RepID=A0A2T7NCC6_POMCA|nr:hypothetical protein C0Q70_21379 [Pomacea canaliculata]
MAANFCIFFVLLAFLPSGELQGFSENSTAWAKGNFDVGRNTIVVTNSTRAVYAHVGTSPKVGHVSVDWVSNNIYWADAGFGWIGLQSLKASFQHLDLAKFATNGRLKVIVSTFLEHPYGLVVAPNYRRVFWSDVGSSPKIESSDLLGSDRKALVWQGLATPTALSVDQSLQRLFWTDQSKHTIESSDFNGGNRRVLYFSEDSQFGGLQVFAEYLLFTQQNTNSLHGLDRLTGKQVVSSLSLPSDPPGPPGSLAVFSTAFQQRGNNISCSQMTCGHICIQQEQGGVCICTSGSTLKSDGKTCQESSVPLWKSFIVSSATRVCAVPVNLLYSFPNLPPPFYNIKCFLNESNIQHLAINSYNATLYYVTGSSWIRTHDIRSGKTDNITTTANSVGGITYDEARGILIWSETSAGRIMELDLNRGDNATQLYSNLNSPGDLTVNSLRGLLFWVETFNNKYTLVAGAVVSPFNKSELVNSGLIRPHSLVYDDKQNRLYWLDVDYLGSVRGDGSDKSVISLSSVTTYRGLALFRSNLVWLTRSPDSNVTFRSSDLRDASVRRPLTCLV